MTIYTSKAIESFCGRMRYDTQKQYRQTITEFLRYAEKPLESITFSDAERYREILLETKLKESTIIKKLRFMRSFCEYVIHNREEIGLMPEQFPINPFEYVVPNRDDEAVPERLVGTPEELDTLLVASEGVKVVRIALLFSAKLMLRMEEFRKLTAAAFSYREDENGVRRMVCRAGLTQASVRTFLVPRDMERDIEDFIASIRDTEERNPSLCLFFNRRDGKLYSGSNLVRMLRKITRAKGMRDVTFNAFRNLGIALCDASAEAIRDLLGSAPEAHHEQRIENLQQLGSNIIRTTDYVAITLKAPGKAV